MGEIKEQEMSDETQAVIVEVNGRKAWLIEGRILPYIAGGTGDPPPADPPPSDPPEPKKVDMTQEALDALIDKKYADAHTKAEASARGEIDALKAEIETMKAVPKKPNEPGKGEDLTAMKERLEKMELRETESKAKANKATLLSVASDLDAVKASHVAALIAPYIRELDDGTMEVINDDKQPRLNADGNPMSIEELGKEFKADNLNLFKAAGNPGGGSKKPNMGSADNEHLKSLPLAERLTAVRAAKNN